MTFDEAMERLFKAEGLFSNHPSDKGGATKYGITLESWAAYRKSPMTLKDVKMITVFEARQFYRDCYWLPLKLDQIENESIRYAIFDQAVNRGSVNVVKQLQKIISEERHVALKIDGILGEETLAHINKMPARVLVLKFIYSCQFSYCRIVQTNPSQLPFLAGWIVRTQELLTLSLGG